MIADIVLFFGRFHPVVLHLPIGMTVLLALYVFSANQIDFSLLRKGLWICLATTAITVLFGLMLATEGGYDASTLMRHKYLGFVFFVAQLLGLLVVSRPSLIRITKPLFIVLIPVLTLTGHFGAILTHGKNYLTEYMPISRISSETKIEDQPAIENIDSAFIFPQVIYPIFGSSCLSCHNSEKQKGGLILSSYQAMMQGSKHGAAVLPGRPELSELLRRVLLPADHPASMPPEGKEPLGSDEITLIHWWIENGAKDSVMVGELVVSGQIKSILNRISGGKADAPFRINAPELDQDKLQAARKAGWDVRQVAIGSNAVRVSAKIQNPDLKALDELAPFIYELDFTGRTIDDPSAEFFKLCSNLSALNLTECANVELALSNLNVDKIKVLNLTETDLADLVLLYDFKELERLYILGSSVKQQQVEEFRSTRQGVTVISERFTFEQESL